MRRGDPGAAARGGPAAKEHAAASNEVKAERNAEEKALAFRLKHDIGKYVRWNAPAEPEASTEALRERLRQDLLSTRATPEGSVSAPELWDAWVREARGFFEDAYSAQILGELSRGMERARTLLSRLDSLPRAELLALDSETFAMSSATTRLHRLAAARTEDSEET